MGSLKEMTNIIDAYDFKRPLDFGDLTEGIFNLVVLSDTKPKEEEEKGGEQKKD